MPRRALLPLPSSIALLAGLVAAGLALGAARAASPGSELVTQVWCYDPVDGIVSRKWPHDCAGRVVDDTEAARLQRDRIDRIRRAFKGPPMLFPNRRLASLGTGFLVSARGHLLTNNHVVAGCTAVSVTPPGAEAVAGKLLAADKARDLALVAAPLAGHPVATFRAREDLAPASDIAVVGYPLLGRVAIMPIFVQGIVTAGGTPPGRDRYLINMDVRHGNSGGPVVDRAGEVVGVVVAKADTPAIYQHTGRVVRDVGVAIRPSVAIAFLRANGVDPEIAPAVSSRGELDDDALFRETGRIVVQVGCWR
jgi:serine protease Do